jgi:hypothetical protein
MLGSRGLSTRRPFASPRRWRLLIALLLLALAAPSFTLPRVAQAGTGSGLKGEYYDNMDLSNLKLTRTDPTVNFDWGSGAPDPSIGVDSFSVLWSGQIEPLYSETYTFYLISDNGRRLWVNGQQIIDKWIDDWNVTYSGQIALSAGQRYDIKIAYFEHVGGANARLEWSSPSQPRQVIPQSQLYPPVPPPGSVDLSSLWDTEKVLVNPHKGWYHHYFDNGIDYYLTRADSDLDNFPGMNHIYLRLAWSYLEPQEGQFNWKLIDDVIDKWTAKGYEISFRISAKETGLTYATPEWVKNAGVPGAFYEKWGITTWEPDYSNPIFLQKLENFHRAFAARYANKPWLAYIDMGSFGNWGEGHNIFGSERAYPSSVIKQHIDIYKRQYPNNLITISDDYAWYNQDGDQTADYVYQQGLAWRDDSLLVHWYVDNFPSTFTVRHPEYFERMWRERPINMELDHYGAVKSAGDWQGQDGAIKGADIVRGAMGLMHPTYIGYHGYADDWLRENPNLAGQLANKMGYWYFIKNVTVPAQLTPGAAATLKLTWENHGVAPAYHPYKLKLKLVGSSRIYSQDLVEANNRAWMPDTPALESYRCRCRPICRRAATRCAWRWSKIRWPASVRSR